MCKYKGVKAEVTGCFSLQHVPAFLFLSFLSFFLFFIYLFFLSDNPPADMIYIWYRPGSVQCAEPVPPADSASSARPRAPRLFYRPLPPLRSAAAPIHQLPLLFIWQISLTWRFVNCVTACARWKPTVRLTNEAGYWRYTGPGVGFIYTVTGHSPAYWCEGLG